MRGESHFAPWLRALVLRGLGAPVDNPMPEPLPDVLALYRTMLTIRRFEERCNYLFMQGRIPSTLHLYIGQEAVATGVCAHLGPADYVTSTHRPHGHAIAKG